MKHNFQQDLKGDGMMYQRALGEKMFKDFQEGGVLHKLLTYVQNDDTLDLEFRGENSASIYYRGGSLFEITQKKDGKSYTLKFNTDYQTRNKTPLTSPTSLAQAVADILLYKDAIDYHRAQKGNHAYEDEFRQVVVRENNGHGDISRASDYYIADLDYPYNRMLGTQSRVKFDMIAVKWLSTRSARKNVGAPTLSVIEMKYGDSALKQEDRNDVRKKKSGMLDHLDDFADFFVHANMNDVCADITEVFRQKCRLGLISKVEDYNIDNITISKENIEFVFLLANHDPASKVLREVVHAIAQKGYPFPIKFAASSMMGYALYADQMKSLAEMQEILSSKA